MGVLFFCYWLQILGLLPMAKLTFDLEERLLFEVIISELSQV
jgi:hypothetical protein